jgi:uncharacterized membrane protein YoaK (UPF0700 family)
MKSFIAEMRETIFPGSGGKDGPLPPLLVGLTFVTGVVDAFSYLVLGHVFVANMTGNVVFVGFALAGAAGFSVAASVTALASFWVGALLGGRISRQLAARRGRLLGRSTATQVALVAVAVVLGAISSLPIPTGTRYALIAVLAVAMGVQNAAARAIALPDLTTTVLTLTMTGIAADSGLAGGPGSRAGRRLVAVIAMFLGALAGAACVLHVHAVIALVIALVVLVAIGATTIVLVRSEPAWAAG